MQHDQVRRDRPTPCVQKNFLEFFAGIGLVRAGLEPSGWKCIYANDCEVVKRRMYEARFGVSNHFHLGDVNDTENVLSRIHDSPFLATASFPCTDLSLAGHYKGFDGKHSSTFFAFSEALRKLGDLKPKVVLLENVPGFLTSHEGNDFRRAVTALASLGYWIDSFVLDAAHFTPQSRQRVFVVGVERELVPTHEEGKPPSGHIFTKDCSILRPKRIERLVQSTKLDTGWIRFNLPSPPKRTLTLESVIDLEDAEQWWGHEEVQRHTLMMHDRHREQIEELIRSRQSWVGTIFRRTRDRQQRAEVRFDGLAGCLRTPSGGSAKQIVIVVDRGTLRMRWMSPREYARLQGATDFPLNDTERNLLWGFADAVCVPAITWIDEKLLTPLFLTASNGEKDPRFSVGTCASRQSMPSSLSPPTP